MLRFTLVTGVDGGRRAAWRGRRPSRWGRWRRLRRPRSWAPSFGGAVGGLQSLAGHAFADDQGAWAILPAFQVGLFAALWIAVAGGGCSWRRALAGLGGVVLVQAAFGVPVGELAHHYGFDPHVGLLRGWALALPAAAVWWLTRPAPFTVVDTPAPRRALPADRLSSGEPWSGAVNQSGGLS